MGHLLHKLGHCDSDMHTTVVGDSNLSRFSTCSFLTITGDLLHNGRFHDDYFQSTIISLKCYEGNFCSKACLFWLVDNIFKFTVLKFDIIVNCRSLYIIEIFSQGLQFRIDTLNFDRLQFLIFRHLPM